MPSEEGIIRCSVCHGRDVQTQYWVDLRTGEVDDMVTSCWDETQYNWCGFCEAHTELFGEGDEHAPAKIQPKIHGNIHEMMCPKCNHWLEVSTLDCGEVCCRGCGWVEHESMAVRLVGEDELSGYIMSLEHGDGPAGARRMALAGTECDSDDCPGWFGNEGGPEIHRCDQCAQFEDDWGATIHVAHLLKERFPAVGFSLHQLAPWAIKQGGG